MSFFWDAGLTVEFTQGFNQSTVPSTLDGDTGNLQMTTTNPYEGSHAIEEPVGFNNIFDDGAAYPLAEDKLVRARVQHVEVDGISHIGVGQDFSRGWTVRVDDTTQTIYAYEVDGGPTYTQEDSVSYTNALGSMTDYMTYLIYIESGGSMKGEVYHPDGSLLGTVTGTRDTGYTLNHVLFGKPSTSQNIRYDTFEVLS